MDKELNFTYTPVDEEDELSTFYGIFYFIDSFMRMFFPSTFFPALVKLFVVHLHTFPLAMLKQLVHAFIAPVYRVMMHFESLESTLEARTLHA